MASKADDAIEDDDYGEDDNFPDVALDPVYTTVTSNVSFVSTTESIDPSWIDDIGFTGGVIQFVYDEAQQEKVGTQPFITLCGYSTIMWVLNHFSPVMLVLITTIFPHYVGTPFIVLN